MTDPCALIDHYTDLFRELRAALPPAQAEAVEAILCGPFYDGPYKVSGAAARKPRKPSIATLIKRAEKSGRPVTSITMPDGTTINFSQEPSGEVDTPRDASVVAPDRIIELCKRGKRGS
jgi:hypothetical protein